MTRAAIYARISRDRTGAGLGVDRQAEECRDLAASRGWDVTATFADNDLSAYSGKPRPGYRALLEAVQRGHVDAILVWHTDRLHRSPRELEGYIEVAGAIPTVAVTGGPLDLSTSAGRMVARQLGAVARYESEHKSERLQSKHRQLAAQGRWSGGGSRRYGYEPGLTAVREEEAAVIRQAARRILNGESLGAVTADLNARGVRSSTGSIWHTHTVKAMLRGAWLSGQREYQKTLSAAAWPAILEPADTARLRAVLQPGTTRAQRTLLASILRCGWEECAHPMGTRPSGRGAAYGCPKKAGGCGSVTIQAAFADECVTRHVIAVLDTPALAARLSEPEADGDAAALAAIEKANRNIAELGELMEAGDLSPRGYADARAALERAIAAAGAKIAAGARSNVVRLVQPGQLAARWPSLTIDQRRAVIKSVVRWVDVMPVGKGRQGRENRLAIIYSGRLDAANVAKAAAVMRHVAQPA